MTKGNPIGRQEAKELAGKSASIKDEYDGYVKGLLTGAGTPIEVRNFYSTSYNGYVFDKDLVMRFFPDANYLLVLIGADAGGTPTVILAGCVDGEEAGTYKTLDISYPASQHPPKYFMTDFPEAFTKGDTNYQITFKMA